MDTLESKLRIAHQIQVAAMKKGLTCSIYSTEFDFTIYIHFENMIVEFLLDREVTEQELLDWWEAIAK